MQRSLPPVEAIARTTVFRAVLERLEALIEESGMQAGDRLPSDRQLAADLGVSRPVVRQAVKVLEGLGRLTVRQGAGTFIRDGHHAMAVRELISGLDIDAKLLADIYDIRLILEVEILRQAMNNKTAQGLEKLKEALRNQLPTTSVDSKEVPLDLEFEAAIGAMADNELLRRFQSLIHELWLEVNLSITPLRHDSARIMAEHEGIYAAIVHDDIDSAASLLAEHLRGVARGQLQGMSPRSPIS